MNYANQIHSNEAAMMKSAQGLGSGVVLGAPPSSSLAQEVQRMHEAVGRLDAVASHFLDRCAPVMRVSAPSPNEASTAEREPDCQIGHEMRCAAVRLEALARIVDAAHQRLAI